MRFVTTDGTRPSCRAAAEKLPSRATRTNAVMLLRVSIWARPVWVVTRFTGLGGSIQRGGPPDSGRKVREWEAVAGRELAIGGVPDCAGASTAASAALASGAGTRPFNPLYLRAEGGERGLGSRADQDV